MITKNPMQLKAFIKNKAAGTFIGCGTEFFLSFRDLSADV